MKPSICLFGATVAVVLVAPTHALGVNLETRDRRGETRLYQAVMNGTIESVTALLRAGANPNARNAVCLTPLHYAAALWRPGAGMALLTAGADPALRDKDGEFPFDEIPAGIGDILRLQAKGLFPPSPHFSPECAKER